MMIQAVLSCSPALAALGKGEFDRLTYSYYFLSQCSHNVSLCYRVDFTVANHVHLIEPHWNPMVEAQAVDRVHRIGQEREVVITRYIMRDSVEKVDQNTTPFDENCPIDSVLQYIQKVQHDKLQLINQSIDSEYSSQDDIEKSRWEVSRPFVSLFNNSAETNNRGRN